MRDEPACSYLKNISSCESRKSNVTTVDQLLNLETVHEILETKALLHVKWLEEKEMATKDTKKKDFVNSVAAIDIVRTVDAHTKFLIFKLFVQKIQSDSYRCPRVKQILTRLCLLFGLCEIDNNCQVCF